MLDLRKSTNPEVLEAAPVLSELQQKLGQAGRDLMVVGATARNTLTAAYDIDVRRRTRPTSMWLSRQAAERIS